jgi:N-acetylglucosamine kinase-like BadF-type ATPase
MNYYLGTDTGSTKSHAVIADENGNAVGFGVGGPGNPQGIGFDGLYQLLDDLTTQATKQAGITRDQIAGVGFGIAGYDWPSQKEKFHKVVAPLGLNAPIDFANDATVGLLAGSSEGWGVAIVSGTSCNGRGRDRNGREGRMTGYSYVFGEYGGAMEIVLRAIQGVTFEWNKRGPATKLTQTFLALTGAQSVDDLIEGATTQQYGLNASAARAVFQTAYDGDQVAIETIQWVGHQLGDMACGIIRQLNFENEDVEIVLVGSTYEGGPLLIDPMRAAVLAVAPRARFVRLSAPPVIGGVLLGMEQGGVNGWLVKDRLIETTNDLMKRSTTTEPGN